MRDVITESPDAGARNRHFNSAVSPRFGTRMSVAGRLHGMVEIELCLAESSDDRLERLAFVRRIA